ncbi:MAG TPA: hypothetical protein VI955_03410, partial [Candidatus Omnitrophota bacterium]|nr:hypothetical protein [Candidatus Omnitrophota bacterium]
GAMKEFYENGSVKQEWVMENGKENGPSRSYYNTVELMTESTYRDGRLNGVVNLYKKDGDLAYIDTYQAGIKEGRQVVSDREIPRR